MHTDGKESHAIVMKAQIQSGNVSNPKTIEASTESARTGKLSGNTMVSIPVDSYGLARKPLHNSTVSQKCTKYR